MSLVSVNEVKAQIAPGIDDDALLTLIERVEAWLASRVGALTGARTATYYPRGSDIYSGPLWLPRPADSVSATDAGIATTVILRGQLVYRNRNLVYGWYDRSEYVVPWVYPVVLTFTPNDEADIRTAVIDLVRLELVNSPYQQEAAGGHSFVRIVGTPHLKDAVAKRILRLPRTHSVTFRTVDSR